MILSIVCLMIHFFFFKDCTFWLFSVSRLSTLSWSSLSLTIKSAFRSALGLIIVLNLLGTVNYIFLFNPTLVNIKCLVILKAELIEFRITLWARNWTCLKTRVTVLKSKFLPRSFISLRNGRVIKWRPLSTTDFWLLTYYCFLWGPYEVQIKRREGPYEVQVKRRDGPYV